MSLVREATVRPTAPKRSQDSQDISLVPLRRAEYHGGGGHMLKLFCMGCVIAFILGSAFRFTLLAQALSKAKLLPTGWRHWLYDLNHRNHAN